MPACRDRSSFAGNGFSEETLCLRLALGNDLSGKLVYKHMDAHDDDHTA